MDDFLATYFILLVIAGICFLLFWGAVIYFVVKFLRSRSFSTRQKMDILAAGMNAYSGGRSGSGDLMDTQAGSAAASVGIDLNDNR